MTSCLLQGRVHARTHARTLHFVVTKVYLVSDEIGYRIQVLHLTVELVQ
jgi:hypothetical protein